MLFFRGQRKPSGMPTPACRTGPSLCGNDVERGMLAGGAPAASAVPGQCHLARIREGQLQALWLLRAILWPNSRCPSQSAGTRPGRARASALASEGPSPAWQLRLLSASQLVARGIPPDPAAPGNGSAAHLSSGNCGCLLVTPLVTADFRDVCVPAS